MQGLDIEIREIPVSFLGQDSGIKASAALCSEDPAAMAASFFMGTAQTRLSTCTDGDQTVQTNTEWASAKGVGGTPMIIATDGRTQSGARGREALVAFLEAGS